MIFNYQEIPINFKFLRHAYNLLKKGKSPVRIFHNFFLNNISLEGKILDLGSGSHSSYFNYINISKEEIYFADKNIKKDMKNFIEVDLEKELNIESNKFDSIILFNVLEHIKNYNNLLKEINRILKIGGKFEIFVPFMHRYHEDPEDYFRPTHFFLTEILKNNNFDVSTNVIGVGPFTVISEILIKYFKFKILKFPFLVFFLLLDKIFKFFSKDYNSFYLGVHCSCTKL